jgi:tight adherence protein B
MINSSATTLLIISFLLIFLIASLIFFYLRSVEQRKQRAAVKKLKRQLLHMTRRPDDEQSPSADYQSKPQTRLQRLSQSEWLQVLTIQSGVAATAEIYLLTAAALAAGGSAIGLIFSGNAFVALFMGTALGALPFLRLMQLRAKRTQRFDSQLPDALDFMAGALRAGHGLALSFRMIADEMPAPISDEFRLVNEKIAFGAAFQDAVNDMRDRVPSQDLDFLVVGLLIQRETGGNIAELFTNLSSLGRERFKLHGKVKVLVSEGKLSGWLLGGLPFVLGGLMTLLNPNYMAPLWSTEQGHELLLTGCGMMAVGFAWMSHIARIRV